jgi:phosphate transport system permease protein
VHLDFFLQTPARWAERENFSAIVGTIALTVVALVIALLWAWGPLFSSGIHPESRVSRVIRFGTDCLVRSHRSFSAFRLRLFVIFLRMGWSILSGKLTLATMILPTIICTAEEAVKAVPTPTGK